MHPGVATHCTTARSHFRRGSPSVRLFFPPNCCSPALSVLQVGRDTGRYTCRTPATIWTEEPFQFCSLLPVANTPARVLLMGPRRLSS